MSARPLDTFASEGYYDTGRAQHYFRRTGEPDNEPLASLCGMWHLGDGLRAWLTVLPKRPRKVCSRCEKRLTEELFKPQSALWFGEVHS